MIIPADVMAEDFDVRNVVACTTQLQTFRVSFSAGLELTGYLSMTMWLSQPSLISIYLVLLM